MQETQLRSLDGEDPLEKEMATHSSIIGLENPMDRGAWQAIVHGVAKESNTTLLGYSSWGLKESGMNEQLRHTHTRLSN